MFINSVSFQCGLVTCFKIAVGALKTLLRTTVCLQMSYKIAFMPRLEPTHTAFKILFRGMYTIHVVVQGISVVCLKITLFTFKTLHALGVEFIRMSHQIDSVTCLEITLCTFYMLHNAVRRDMFLEMTFT